MDSASDAIDRETGAPGTDVQDGEKSSTKPTLEELRQEQLAEMNRVLSDSGEQGDSPESNDVWTPCSSCKDPVKRQWDVCPGCQSALVSNKEPEPTPSVPVNDEHGSETPLSNQHTEEGAVQPGSEDSDGHKLVKAHPIDDAAEHAKRVAACRSKPPSLRTATHATPGRKESRVSFQENLEETFPIESYIAEANENENSRDNDKVVSGCCLIM